MTSPSKSRRLPVLRAWNRKERRELRRVRREEATQVELPEIEGPQVDIAPNDPALAYFQSNPEPVDIDTLKLDSPGITALREAGVKLVVPLVTQGELIGLLNLGPRLSEQEYSADDRKLLENLAGQAAPALRVAQLVKEQEAEVRRRERYEQELQVAQLIQQNFLPKELPDHAGWSLNAFYRPAREVGGDFYDFVDLPDGRLGVVVGDVTDKGVPAALVMASTRSVLRASAQRLIDPSKVLERVNDQLVPDMPPKMFVTCLYGVLEPDTGRFVFANAGHNLPCVQTEEGAFEPRAAGMPLGLIPGMSYEENEVVIGAGQAAMLYSDALPEAHGPGGEMFGFPSVLEVVGGTSRDDELIDPILDSLHRFTGPDWEQEDDITLVTLRRTAHVLNEPVSEIDLTDAGDDPGQVLAEFSVPSEAGNERAVMERVGEAVADYVLGSRLEMLKTAVAEATMNAIEHGNKLDASLLVEIRAWVDEGAVVVRVTDRGGGPEAPHAPEMPDIEAKLRGEQSPRGWGLFLIRNMVDDLNVITDDEHHIVELVVRTEEGEGR
ncbi:MAG: SpoIIE family protein phosphatase [Nitriliruptorales bacterium]|nr:SpoIIE family protein phosphatase [Nitriliruptorales bacterium]